jgi:hypothetical protein
MNRSILIVICDFLLVSLLAFSTVELNQVTDASVSRPPKFEIATNSADGGKDLTAVMKLALSEEQQNRERLLAELTRTRETMVHQQSLLGEREQLASRLQEQQTNLQQQVSASQASLQALNQQLKSAATEAATSKAQLTVVEADLRKQTDQSAALRGQLDALTRSNQMALAEQQRLANRLQIAEVERRYATQQASNLQAEVKIEREEKAKLAEGVKALGTKSTELAREIRDNRPLAPNTIFDEFLSNSVQVSFQGVRPGVFGKATRTADTRTIVVADGTNLYAMCHVQDTPLAFSDPGTEWQDLTAILGRNSTQVPMRSLSFGWPDPRVVSIPINAAQAGRLGCKIYRTSTEPYKFQDAVLVGAREGYYGECQFQIDPTTPDYVRLDRSFLKGLFGKINPSRGDLVFSRQGELLGIMANNSYCIMLRHFDPVATFDFGRDIRAQRPGETLSRLYAVVAGLPSKLQ